MKNRKVEIWVSPDDAHWWMTDRNLAHVYGMNFAYRETPTYNKKVVIDFEPVEGDGKIIEDSKLHHPPINSPFHQSSIHTNESRN